jgi:hypothetical protein
LKLGGGGANIQYIVRIYGNITTKPFCEIIICDKNEIKLGMDEMNVKLIDP